MCKKTLFDVWNERRLSLVIIERVLWDAIVCVDVLMNMQHNFEVLNLCTWKLVSPFKFYKHLCWFLRDPFPSWTETTLSLLLNIIVKCEGNVICFLTIAQCDFYFETEYDIHVFHLLPDLSIYCKIYMNCENQRELSLDAVEKRAQCCVFLS